MPQTSELTSFILERFGDVYILATWDKDGQPKRYVISRERWLRLGGKSQ
jgi:hypothetical protein